MAVAVTKTLLSFTWELGPRGNLPLARGSRTRNNPPVESLASVTKRVDAVTGVY